MAYSFRRSITVDQTKVPSTQTDFTVLVSGTYAYLATVANGGKVQHGSGFDIAFFSDQALTTPLKFARKRFVAATGEVIFHVKIPSLDGATDTVFYIAYGDSGISTDQADPANAWASGFKLVALYEDGTTLDLTDETANNNDGTGVNTPSAGTGKVGGGLSLASGSTEYVDHGSAASLDNLTQRSIVAWVKRTNIATNRDDTILVKGSFGTKIRRNSGGGANQLSWECNWSGSTSATAIWRGGSALTDTTHFYRVGITYDKSSDANDPAMYVDGAAETVSEIQAPIGTVGDDSASSLIVGANSVPAQPFGGIIDELLYYSGILSADWFTTDHNNQNSPSTFYAIGSEESVGGTQFTQSVSGGITPAGALAKQGGKPLGGGITPAATLVRHIVRALAGAITPSGALVPRAGKALAGSVAPAGTLSFNIGKVLAGALAPAGDLLKRTGKVLGGAITPTGTLASIRTFLVTLAGAITPSGGLSVGVGKALVGVVAPVGALLRQTGKVLAGAVTPSSTLTALRTVLVSLAGALTPSGGLSFAIGKNLAGAVTPLGTLSKRVGKVLAGALTPVGDLIAAAVTVVTLVLVRLIDRSAGRYAFTDCSASRYQITDRSDLRYRLTDRSRVYG